MSSTNENDKTVMKKLNNEFCEKKYIEKHICVKARLLNEDININVYKEFKQKYADTCDENHGYIMIVYYNNMQILSNAVTPASLSGEVNMKISAYVKILKPKKNVVYKGLIYKVIPQGIIVNIIPDAITALVTNDNIKKGAKLKEHDIIDVSVKEIKFISKKFQCIGETV
jgi:DNA-directed RNA polymerase subunit E'/Rpb7